MWKEQGKEGPNEMLARGAGLQYHNVCLGSTRQAKSLSRPSQANKREMWALAVFESWISWVLRDDTTLGLSVAGLVLSFLIWNGPLTGLKHLHEFL